MFARHASRAAVLTAGLLLSLPGLEAARGDESLPMPARPGDILRIPGLPPVQLPPGAKVFGPHGPEIGGESPAPRPSTRGEAPSATPPQSPDQDQAGDASHEKAAPRLSLEAQRQQILDALFKQLAAATTPEDGKAIAGAIEKVWMRSGSDTADLLMSRAMAAMVAGKMPLSIELLDHVVEIAPDWAEAWNRRATARFLADDFDGSMADIDQTLRLEPRHYGALSGLATILQRSGNDKRALEVLKRVNALYPQQPDVQKLIDKLAPEIDGRDI